MWTDNAIRMLRSLGFKPYEVEKMPLVEEADKVVNDPDSLDKLLIEFGLVPAQVRAEAQRVGEGATKMTDDVSESGRVCFSMGVMAALVWVKKQRGENDA